VASDEVSGKNEKRRSFHHPDLVGAGAERRLAVRDGGSGAENSQPMIPLIICFVNLICSTSI